MGLLDGNTLKQTFGAVFTPLYGDATLYRIVRQANGAPVQPTVFATGAACKAQVENYSNLVRAQRNIPDKDIRLFILQATLEGAAPTQDDEIEVAVKGRRYRISQPITEDPARAYWDLRGTPV